VTIFLLTHRHAPQECGPSFAAWKGFESPLRRRPAIASCIGGGHCLWWTVEAPDEERALAQLPPFIADRTEVTAVREVTVP
jgi:hypothetical protein